MALRTDLAVFVAGLTVGVAAFLVARAGVRVVLCVVFAADLVAALLFVRVLRRRSAFVVSAICFSIRAVIPARASVSPIVS